MRYRKEILYCEGGETQEHVAQRTCGCTICGGVHGQDEQPDLVKGVPVHFRALRTR